jgi:hypothetical protein
MDLPTKFKNVASSPVFEIFDLAINVLYPIQAAVRVETLLGPTVMLTLRDTAPHYSPRVYLPIEYGRVVSDTDINDINNNKIWVFLTYKGKTGSFYNLAID